MPAPAPAPHLALVRSPGHRRDEDDAIAEAEARRALAALSARRRARGNATTLQRDYRFTAEDGREVGLLDLFGSHDTLVTYFWRYGPQQERPCPDCARRLDPLDANAELLEARAGLVVFGRSPVQRQRAFATARGWTQLRFCETRSDDYARDLGGLNAHGEETPLLVVFRRDARGEVRVLHTAAMTAEAELEPLCGVLEPPR